MSEILVLRAEQDPADAFGIQAFRQEALGGACLRPADEVAWIRRQARNIRATRWEDADGTFQVPLLAYREPESGTVRRLATRKRHVLHRLRRISEVLATYYG